MMIAMYIYHLSCFENTFKPFQIHFEQFSNDW